MEVVHVEEVMGTMVSIAAYGELSSSAAVTEVMQEACRELHRLEAIFSTWKPESPMSRLRRGDMAWREAPAEVEDVLSRCAEAKLASNGWFDPWAMPGGVDPTGMVKGWALEQAMNVLRQGGVTAAMINAGGDVATHGQPSPGERWRVGIRQPWRSQSLACIVEVSSAIATSGTYERGAHLFDPFAGRPAARAASATVIGPDLAMADALATALAIGGDHVLRLVAALDGYEAYLIRKDGSEAQTVDMSFAA